MIKKILTILYLFVFVAIPVLVVNIDGVCAGTAVQQFNNGLEKTAEETGHSEMKISDKDPTTIVGEVIRVVLSFLGVVFLILGVIFN